MSAYTYIATFNHAEQKSTATTVFGPLETKNIKIEPAVKILTKSSSFFTSPVRYCHDGKLFNLTLLLPESDCFFNVIYPYGTDKDMQTENSQIGYQLCYLLSTKETAIKPTPAEQFYIDALRQINRAVYNQLKRTVNDRDPFIPAISYSTFKGASPDDINSVVKPLITVPKKNSIHNSRTPDPDSPLRLYVKFKTSGYGAEIALDSSLYTFEKKRLAQHELGPFINKFCRAKALLTVQDIYWGSHGTTSYGASARIRIDKAFIKERAMIGGVSEDVFLSTENNPPEVVKQSREEEIDLDVDTDSDDISE